MQKQSVNRRLREELSPVRSPSHGRSGSGSSASSRENGSRSHRRHSRSPRGYSRNGQSHREEDHYGRLNAPQSHKGKSSYSSRPYDSHERSSRKSEDDYTRKRTTPHASEDYPVKKPRKEGTSPSRNGYHVEQGQPARNNRPGSSNGPPSQAKPPADQGKPHAPERYVVDRKAKPTDFHAGANPSVARPGIEQRNETSSTNGERDGDVEQKGKQADSEEASAGQATQELTAEERRKRRETIRAKFQNQSSDLRVQALQQNAQSSLGSPKAPSETADTATSQAQSPTSDAQEDTSPQSSPRTPGYGDIVGSPEPVAVANDAELANVNNAARSAGEADEPSAADYDPTEDMREYRKRHDKRLENEDVSAQAYDEQEADQHQVPIPEEGVVKPAETEAAKQKSAADDMFASDEDEDDMFAAQPTQRSTKPSSQQAKSVSKTKEIDTSMLDNWDDPDGYYRPILGETLDGRYQVQSNLGKGMFSGVVRATDVQTSTMKAIKIIRNNESMVKAAQKEMAILEKLAEADPDDKKHIVRLERSFTHRDHLCLVFENLSLNLREVLKKFGRDVGINIKAIRSYAQQMFLALGLMQKCNIFHADLKPDNILVNEDRASLKICDLGSAGDGSDFEIAPYLVSRYYRAPEIILGCPYNFAIDTWSIGCTLFELFTGKILFTGRDNNGMLRSIMETRGKISLKVLKKAEFGAQHFDDASLSFRSIERDRVTGRDVVKLLNFQKPTRELKDRVLAAAPRGIKDADRKELLLFADLLDKCLLLNPERRITPAEALKHPFIHRAMAPFGSK